MNAGQHTHSLYFETLYKNSTDIRFSCGRHRLSVRPNLRIWLWLMDMLWSLLSILAQKSIPLVVQNRKFVAGLVWKNLVSIRLTKEYGALAFPFLLKFSYIEFTFNRSFSMVLKLGLWHELWKTKSLLLTTSASDLFFGFRTQDECWCTTPSRLSSATVVAHPTKTSPFLPACS